MMNKSEAYKIVYDDLINHYNLFKGIYDGKHGKREFMNGIMCVMEMITYNISDECANAFNKDFIENIIASEDKARQSEIQDKN